jgi:hypothetical protein
MLVSVHTVLLKYSLLYRSIADYHLRQPCHEVLHFTMDSADLFKSLLSGLHGCFFCITSVPARVTTPHILTQLPNLDSSP